MGPNSVVLKSGSCCQNIGEPFCKRGRWLLKSGSAQIAQTVGCIKDKPVWGGMHMRRCRTPPLFQVCVSLSFGQEWSLPKGHWPGGQTAEWKDWHSCHFCFFYMGPLCSAFSISGADPGWNTDLLLSLPRRGWASSLIPQGALPQHCS